MDTTYIADGAFVSLKLVEKSDHPYATEIATYLSTSIGTLQPLCLSMKYSASQMIKILKYLLVMPFLRSYGSPRFDTFGECVDFLRQIFEVSYLLSATYAMPFQPRRPTRE